MKNRTHPRGAITVEMTLVGIPLIFVLILTFEISRGMWMYHTMAHATREGVRFAIVHGHGCVPNPPVVNNNCVRTVGDIATVIANAAVGLDADTTNLTFKARGTTVPPPRTIQIGDITCSLKACLSNTTAWPPVGANGLGQVIEIDIDMPFRSAMAAFWPGTQPQSFTVTKFAASSSDQIQF